MNKELQDLAWSVLPKKFKEEVKETYKEYAEKIASKSEPEYRIVGYIAAQTELELLFGIHNLTSDAEGEEMLVVSRKRVQNLYNSHKLKGHHLAGEALIKIFGSKCLPDEVANEDNFTSKEPKYRVNDKVICGVVADRKECIIVHYNINTKEYKLRVIENGAIIHRSEEFIYGYAPQEPKPAEPKFKRGDMVRISCAYDDGEIWDKVMHGRIVTVKSVYRNAENKEILMYQFKEGIRDFAEHWLEPYTEPHQPVTECNHFPDSTKMPNRDLCDKLMQRGFRDYNRLHIAAMAMQGLLANEGVSCFTNIQKLEHIDFITYHALEYADKLIKKANQDGQD